MMEDPEGFLDTLRGKRMVLDEIHRLAMVLHDTLMSLIWFWIAAE